MNKHHIHPLRRATLAALLGSAVFAIPAQAETLRVGIRELAGAQGNPYSGGIQSPGSFTWSAIYEQLTQNGEGGVSQPLLATGWKNIDPTTWEFTLRPGVKFSNGEMFDANAVKAQLAVIGPPDHRIAHHHLSRPIRYRILVPTGRRWLLLDWSAK